VNRPPGVDDWQLYRRLLSYLLPAWWLFLLSLAGFVLYALGNVLLADLAQFLLDSLGDTSAVGTGLIGKLVVGSAGVEDLRSVARVVVPVALIVLAGVRATGFFLGSYFMSHVARGVIHTLRCQLFERMLVMPVAHFERFSQGELVSKLTFNVEQVAGAVTEALKVGVREGLTVIALLAYMFYLNWQLTLLFLAVAPLIAGVVTVVGRHFRRYSRRIQASMGDVTQIANESIAGFREVRLYGGQEQQAERFRAISDYNRVQSLKLAFVNAVSTPLIQTLLAAGLALLVWVILDPDFLAGFSAGALVAFLGAAAQLGKPIRQLSSIQVLLQRGLAAAEDIFAQIDADAEPDLGTYAPERPVRGDIRFDSVVFHYPGAERPALDGVSLHVHPGECVALVGPSGSGKSTLVNLLARLQTPDAGSVQLDGRPLGDYRLSALRAQLAVVSQRVLLFKDSIRNNIAYGVMGEVTTAQIAAAATAAQAEEFIAPLPRAYDTLLGDAGAGLSGGQAQRIAIARALLRNAPVLILDEATAALDAPSEARVQQALEAAMQGRTTLVIAHRMATVERADRIVVLERGHIVDTGRHGELLQRCTLYAQLCRQELRR